MSEYRILNTTSQMTDKPLFSKSENVVNPETVKLENFLRNALADSQNERAFAQIALLRCQPDKDSKDWFMEEIKTFIQKKFEGNIAFVKAAAQFNTRPYPKDASLKEYMDVVYAYAKNYQV